MAGFRDLDKALFPIKHISAVVKLFRNQLEDTNEPDLALLSIVTGLIENQLTSRSNAGQLIDSPEITVLPRFELETVENLYRKFKIVITGSVEPNKAKTYATRDLVKRVSDVIWNSLTRSYYKDRAHLQSLYSYLTGSKLDCFGVAFAVVAGCQVLGYDDVHLALSEDHAWVVFGPHGSETAEVTWHGKGNEDKRGQEIGKGDSARSWLYVNNKPVVCTRQMEVAALVSAINPSLNASVDATEVALLQQELLWLLYDLGHLKKYPMAIGNLGDLEEISPKRPGIACSALFEEAIDAARRFYNNQHVYPYTYQGGYYFRNKKYKEAFESWANASDVIRLYNYSRDDEEIYKEFLEIANEHIPYIMKIESSGFEANTILKKSECFANLLKFYDGICQWEEGSATPVLHIGWAKPLVNTISKFDADVRAQVHIVCDNMEEKLSKKNGSIFNNNNNNNYEKEHQATISKSNNKDQTTSHFYPTIEALTAACSEKILNPEYLLQGDGSPFVGPSHQEHIKIKIEKTEETEDGMEMLQPEIDIKPQLDIKQEDLGGESTIPVVTKKEEEKENGKPGTSKSPDFITKHEDYEEELRKNRPTVVLHSQKMKELKDLLLAEKLNTHAISLHLTAQSQVQVGKRGKSDSTDTSNRPKRTRRD
ncbi:menin isoform X1 [Dendroctonus ponderosae]|uniref:menin isoform X1 n=1 Tax=Dendroctonus ponderosae TaxID=77166 RepID=UPI0020358079|nr:menin isoform X1 [Dendroctonus ponderosae]XP_048517204.1 menin isoform X1 [Dendroctonus ponderosae]